MRTAHLSGATSVAKVRIPIALHVLRAKRAYLPLVTDSRRRLQIERSWRRHARGTVLRELLYARPEQRDQVLSDLGALAAETGSGPARLAVAAFRRTPLRVSAGALRSIRYTARLWRGVAAAR